MPPGLPGRGFRLQARVATVARWTVWLVSWRSGDSLVSRLSHAGLKNQIGSPPSVVQLGHSHQGARGNRHRWRVVHEAKENW